MQGSWVAGAVVYAILALVQLLVVSRGAERVAEVAARFTLDALPGKQMAIDAELRAGAIDGAEAGRRRRALEQESQLHGAMDGALKFVKGDAVAGIAIALVNAVGGLAAGVLRGMAPGEAARRYVLLAVGDGLASQVPALLLAVAAGIAVTRVSGDDRSVASRVARELVAEPRALVASGALLLALGLAPGLPAAPFLAIGAAMAASASARCAAARGPARTGRCRWNARRELAPVDAVAVEISPDLVGAARGRRGLAAGGVRGLPARPVVLHGRPRRPGRGPGWRHGPGKLAPARRRGACRLGAGGRRQSFSAWRRPTSFAWSEFRPDRRATRSRAPRPRSWRRGARRGPGRSDRCSTRAPGRSPRRTPRSVARLTC